MERRNFFKIFAGGSAALFLPKTIIESPWKKRIVDPNFNSTILINGEPYVYSNLNIDIDFVDKKLSKYTRMLLNGDMISSKFNFYACSDFIEGEMI